MVIICIAMLGFCHSIAASVPTYDDTHWRLAGVRDVCLLCSRPCGDGVGCLVASPPPSKISAVGTAWFYVIIFGQLLVD